MVTISHWRVEWGANQCSQEYHRTARAFRTVFRDHIDAELHARVKARKDWLKN